MEKIRIISSGTPELSPLLENEKEVFLVYDRNVAGAAAEISAMLGDKVVGNWPVEATEANKTMDTILSIERSMMLSGLTRRGFVLAVGGGITTDVAGFAASIYKRGVRFANVPTTLLAMVDAAIGGKTGVNLDRYKNMIGAFHQPEFILIDSRFLETLPEREYRNGLAELLKTFLIADADLYEKALGGISEHLILEAGKIKASVVEEDPFEKGRRIILNLGHTFAHAIERLSEGAVSHGEAVSMGIILAGRLSDRTGVADGLEKKLRRDFESMGLPTECPFGIEEMAGAMQMDKKSAGKGLVQFVLLEAPGRPVAVKMKIENVCEELLR